MRIRYSGNLQPITMELQTQIEELFARRTDIYGDEHFSAFAAFKTALNEGRIRAAPAGKIRSE